MSTQVYAIGLIYMSVCSDDDREAMLKAVNEEHPTGLDHGWDVADEAFRDGSVNPHDCERGNGRKHYLLVC